MEHRPAQVGAGVVEDGFLRAVQAQRHQAGRIGAEAGLDVECVAGGGPAQGAALVVGAPRGQHAPGGGFRVAHAQFGAPVGPLGLGGADPEVGVREPADDVAGVLADALEGAVAQVHAQDVVEARVAVVGADQHLMGELGVGGERVGLCPGEGRQVRHGPGADVDLVEVPVLVAVQILGVDEVLVVRGPEVGADAAAPVLGDRPCGGVRARGLGEPQVEDALVGGQEGQAAAVGGDLRRGLDRVSEQLFAGDGHWRNSVSSIRLSASLSTRTTTAAIEPS